MPHQRYGDTAVIRALAGSLRRQGEQLRDETDHLVRRAAATRWSGLAADAMRRSVAAGAAATRRTVELHDLAAAALDQHADEVDRRMRLIATVEHAALTLVEAARRRLHGLAGFAAAVLPDPVDHLLARFDPPPSGHRDWLTVGVPGLPADLTHALVSLADAVGSGSGR